MTCERCWKNKDWIHSCTKKINKLFEKIRELYPNREEYIVTNGNMRFMTDIKPNLVEVVEKIWYQITISTLYLSKPRYIISFNL